MTPLDQLLRTEPAEVANELRHRYETIFMNQNQTRVKKWMQDFGQETPDRPGMPSEEVRLLRAKLILEEAFETINKGLGVTVHYDGYDIHSDVVELFITGPGNLIELADGCADLEVVNLGTAIACGIDLQPCFEEVMRSNDSKAWTVEETNSSNLPDSVSYYKNQSGKFIVKRADGKVIKSPSYTPANLAPIIEAQRLDIERLHLGSGTEVDGGGR